jgi:hypothetical protein
LKIFIVSLLPADVGTVHGGRSLHLDGLNAVAVDEADTLPECRDFTRVAGRAWWARLS